MAGNRFFTVMVVPEKSQRVVKLIIPGYLFKGFIAIVSAFVVLAVIMVLDYANVMGQINENRQLKIENRQLTQSVQVFKTKLETFENTLDRVRTFTTKLKIITNIEDIPAAPSGGAPTNVEKEGDKTTSQNSEAPAVLLAQSPMDVRPILSPEAKKRRELLGSLFEDSGDALAFVDFTEVETSPRVRNQFEKLEAAFDSLNEYLRQTEQHTQDVLDRLADKRERLAATPTRIPTLGGYITSDYGVRVNPVEGRRKLHEGIDVANRFGADIKAPADGEVSFAGVKPGYGLVITLNHGNSIETLYAHASKIYVKRGQQVKRGDRLAAVGNSGHSTGPHLHYEVRVSGTTVDPCGYILDSTCNRSTITSWPADLPKSDSSIDFD